MHTIPEGDKGKAEGVAALDSNGRVPDSCLPPYGMRPADLGMKAWAFDPAAAQTDGRAPSDGSFRFIAVPVREESSVSAVVFHVFGYEGSGLDDGSTAGIFDSNGEKVAKAGDMVGASKMSEEHDTGGGTQAIELTESVTLGPGVYYIGLWWTYTDSDKAPVILTAESSGTCPVVTLTDVQQFGNIAGLSSFPSSFDPGDNERDPIRFWAALA